MIKLCKYLNIALLSNVITLVKTGRCATYGEICNKKV